jgi:Ala-tRNA(Pro) deacylase
MSQINQRLKQFLDARHVGYEMIPHRPDYTAQETAADTHTPGQEFAKTVIVRVDRGYAMAVLPAHHKVNLRKLGQVAGARDVRLASEDEIARVCPDCAVGAEPPFGNLYEMPVYVSETLAEDDRITFNAGTHEEAVRMRYRDYETLVHPHVADISTRA